MVYAAAEGKVIMKPSYTEANLLAREIRSGIRDIWGLAVGVQPIAIKPSSFHIYYL